MITFSNFIFLVYFEDLVSIESQMFVNLNYSERKSLVSKNPANSFESCSENNPNNSKST